VEEGQKEAEEEDVMQSVNAPCRGSPWWVPAGSAAVPPSSAGRLCFLQFRPARVAVSSKHCAPAETVFVAMCKDTL